MGVGYVAVADETGEGEAEMAVPVETGTEVAVVVSVDVGSDAAAGRLSVPHAAVSAKAAVMPSPASAGKKAPDRKRGKVAATVTGGRKRLIRSYSSAVDDRNRAAYAPGVPDIRKGQRRIDSFGSPFVPPVAPPAGTPASAIGRVGGTGDSVVALIPARGGSKRLPGKNTRPLRGVPLIAYAITAARASGEFSRIVVSSDDDATLEIASRYGAEPLRRPYDLATDSSPDIGWVCHALSALSESRPHDTFAILRPTSPFRTAATIRRAFAEWRSNSGLGYTSLRAVERASQHPGKMWRLHASELVPLLPQPVEQPWHDSQHTTLPEVYVQNASLEIAPVRTVIETGTISGGRVLPFLTRDNEGLDVNSEIDWAVAELLVKQEHALLPAVGNGP